ncbi:hypothetical protein ACHAXA_003079 [Cyclostephanos tholiformis]|uniref:Peptidase A1 domain-containing protein n=1 Tax=Cyclostephanos tholiformis TaxID=382380 RepID=A0ABD3RBH2_9STRA
MIAIVIVVLAAAATAADATPLAAASSSSSSSTTSQYQYRILTNAEAGTIIHPLIPHRIHLDRRRRELREKHGAEFDVGELLHRSPPRPGVSRHSLTPKDLESLIASTSSHGGLIRGAGGTPRALQQQMGALYQGYGTHYVDLWVGSPTPQRQTVIVDTGSGVTAFPCEECDGCGDDYHTDNYYRHSESLTFRPVGCNECTRGYCASVANSQKCRISMSYAEGSSWTAYEAVDLCYAGGPHHDALAVNGPMTNQGDSTVDHVYPDDASQFAFELNFGCQVSITGLFITQLADGIMGMENEGTSFWKQMHSRGAIPRPEFSLCFSRSDYAESEGTSAGAITLGGVDTRLHQSPMVFAKNTQVSGFYSVHLKAVFLRAGGGTSAQTTQADADRLHKLPLSEDVLNNGNVIVDSGTTDTYFSRALDGPFKQIWKKLTGEDYNHNPISISPEEIAALPTILMVMSGYDGDAVGDEPTDDPDDVAGYAGITDLSSNPRDVVLAIPASHYLEYDPDIGKYVPRFYTDEGSGSVIGANAMMGHDVFFDNGRGRIGFAESDCDYMSLLMNEEGSISVAPVANAESNKAAVPVDEGPTSEEEEEETGIQNDDYQEGEGIDDGVVTDDEFAMEEATEGYIPDKPSEKNNNNPYQVFGNDKPDQEEGSVSTSFASEIFEDMKHECSSAGCRGIAALFILGAVAIVIAGIRRTIARRRVVRQYQEAELEISDLALDSDSDDEGGYADEPRMREIS